jgi:glycosyltransferase involved in cell wall biosynthesis
VVVKTLEPGGIMTTKAREKGIEVREIKEDLGDFKPDVMHLNDFWPTQFLLSRYPKHPAIVSVHSELPMGNPMVSERVKKYICIRESIQRKVVQEDLVSQDRTVFIPNGFDTSRFNTNYEMPHHPRKKILFVGTINVLRKEALAHTFQIAEDNDWDVQVIGQRLDRFLDGYPNWIHVDPEVGGVWNIEDYVKACDLTAGILLGRTTIEGWLCSKPGIIFDIDLNARVTDWNVHDPPDDVMKYDAKNVVKQLLEVYNEAMVE